MPPALRAALLCESVLTESDGVHSAIRIFNRLQIAPGHEFEAKLLLMLANTTAVDTGEHKLLMRVENLATEVLGSAEFAVSSPLDAGETFSVIVPFRFQAPPTAGMYWLRFAYDTEDQFLTRVPFHFDHPLIV